MLLYILKFKSEPLIKIGRSKHISNRVLQLGKKNFDLSESFTITATDKNCIHLLEKNLHAIFAEYRATSSSPLSSGNTELFHASILPKVLHSIEAFKGFFVHAQLSVEKGVSVPIKKKTARKPTAQNETQMLLDELSQWCSQKHGRQLEISEHIGASKQKVSDWLSGRASPGVRWHFAIRRFLDERN